ncbi:hypothetical protein UFOVP354_50 [uncultured Caudovirales phage]|uniref:Uncharacterized protein n=1 Tax=uncultured Caudovirales phage TaxID=2100421 RepID=A0A6J5M127_9CAUD|nr:hypothetical protein UFOVP354_50 [uncultured Caudovirales phage]
MSNYSLAARAPRKCGVCQTVFEPPKRHSQYCTPACGRIGSSQKQKGKPKMESIKKWKTKKKYPKDCEYCGKKFEAYRMEVRFCTPLCGSRGQARIARISKATSKPYTLEPSDINRDKSFYLERAKAFLAAGYDPNVLSQETRDALERAQRLVDRSNGI